MADQQMTQELPVINQRVVKPENLWVNYDEELDTLIMYITGKPVPSATFWLSDDFMLLVSLDDSKEVVGFQIEEWEKSFVPANSQIASRWPGIKKSLSPIGWSDLLRMFGASILFSFIGFDNQQRMVVAAPAMA